MLLTIAFNHKHPERIIQIAKLLYFLTTCSFSSCTY